MYRFGVKSRGNLAGVHTDLVLVAGRAITLSPVDFSIVEGRRSIERQHLLVAAGRSRTLNSRHLDGLAIDTEPWIDGVNIWEQPEDEQWRLFGLIADAMLEASTELGIPIEWGGNWTSFKDGPHFQLPRATHPSAGVQVA